MFFSGVESNERLITRRGRNGLYAVRSEFADTNPHGPGGSGNPFGFFAKVKDVWNSHADYTLTEPEALEKLQHFENKKKNNGSDFTF